MTAESREHDTCQHRLYWMTCAELDELVARAQGRCEICGILGHLTPHGRLHIDHDGKAGAWAVRGLLCSRCNTNLDRGLLVGTAVDAYLAQLWRRTPPPAFLASRRQPLEPATPGTAECDPIERVAHAFAEIERATQQYRATLRLYLDHGQAIGERGRQSEIARLLNRSRETLRRDAEACDSEHLSPRFRTKAA